MLTLTVGIHHQYHGGIIRHFPDDNRQRVQPGKLGCVLTAVAGDDLIPAFWAGSRNQRGQYAVSSSSGQARSSKSTSNDCIKYASSRVRSSGSLSASERERIRFTPLGFISLSLISS